MSSALRSYLKLRLPNFPSCACTYGMAQRNFSDDKFNNPQLMYSSSTILVENGFNVQELPVIVRKLDFSQTDDKIIETKGNSYDSQNYRLIQDEFKKCIDLRDVFTLLSKCTKITPNIALGAIERINTIEKEPNALAVDSHNIHINVAKGAILDKLLKVVMKTEDTQTVLNILNTVSTFMEPYKYKFSEELLFRVIDNRLTINEICDFIKYLIQNKNDPQYFATIDKLWVGFVEKEAEINESNIAEVFAILHGLKASKRIIFTLLEQKLTNIWFKISANSMQEILNTFVQEKYLSLQCFAVIGSWLNTNIHSLDEDALLDIISKLTRLKYTDDQIENAVEKYLKMKGSKINSHVLIVGILNYCMQFQIRNPKILNICSTYFLSNVNDIPPSFLNSLIHPFGYLYFDPDCTSDFWSNTEHVLNEVFHKMLPVDLCSIVLAYIYLQKYPLNIVSKMFKPEYLVKITDDTILKKLNLIDTVLSLECQDYIGPLLPKDQWSSPVSQDCRVVNIVKKTWDSFENVAGGADKLSLGVLIPNVCSNETYFIDVMLHPAGFGSNVFNWKTKLIRNGNIAILIHLPDHYCSDNEQLVGPQMLRKRHLKILGFKVVSLKYSLLSQFYTTHNTSGLRQYLIDSISKAETCQ